MGQSYICIEITKPKYSWFQFSTNGLGSLHYVPYQIRNAHYQKNPWWSPEKNSNRNTSLLKPVTIWRLIMTTPPTILNLPTPLILSSPNRFSHLEYHGDRFKKDPHVIPSQEIWLLRHKCSNPPREKHSLDRPSL